VSKLPIKAALKAADAFRRQNTRAAIAPILLFVGGGAVRAAGELTVQTLVMGAGSLIQLIAWVIAGTALMRLALADEHPGDAAFQPGALGLQWNAQEWRFLAVTLITGAAAFVTLAVPVLLAGFVKEMGPSGRRRPPYRSCRSPSGFAA
jgi:hypothetical protein